MKRSRVTCLVVFFLVLTPVGLRWYSRAHRAPHTLAAPLSPPEGRFHSYSTNFPVAENPLSGRGKWIDGRTVGLDWSSVAAVRGLAYGTESGTGRGDKSYDDSTTLLAGEWAPDQTIEARVHSINQTDRVLEEVELRLRSSVSPHTSTGYEVLFRCLRTPQAYASIVRWDGPLGRFIYLQQKSGLQYGVGDGDLVRAAIAGTLITAQINGVEVLRASDAAYSNGSPGIGFWLQRHSGIRAWLTFFTVNTMDYGFSDVAAWDEAR